MTSASKLKYELINGRSSSKRSFEYTEIDRVDENENTCKIKCLYIVNTYKMRVDGIRSFLLFSFIYTTSPTNCSSSPRWYYIVKTKYLFDTWKFVARGLDRQNCANVSAAMQR